MKENVLMQLLYTNCVSILTYGCAAKEFSASEMSSCNTAINMAIRKIFSYSRWESVRLLRQMSGFDSIYEIFEKAKSKFIRLASCSSNGIIKHLTSF